MSLDQFLSAQYQSRSDVTRIPTLHAGEAFNPDDATQYPSDMNLVAQFQEASKSVARIEAVKGYDEFGTPTGSTGSGFVVRSDGEIATDLHVVKGASDIRINLNNRMYSATIDAVDPKTDLALLRITNAAPGEYFKPVNLAPSSQMEQGDTTVALGYPGGAQKLFMAPGGFSWAPGGFQGYRRFGDIVGNLKGGLMPGEDPNRTSIEANVNADTGISGGPMFNSRFQVVGVMDIGNTTGTKGDATPVEDLYRLLNATQRVRTAMNTGSIFNLQPAGSDYSQQTSSAPLPGIAAWAQSYFANSRPDVQSNSYPQTSAPTTWSTLAQMLDGR
ncbi:MAG TPA: serine protease [Drouetiella sp.]